MAGLYIHIPFCAGKCAYCDFVSYAGRRRDMARYLSALKTEIAARAGEAGFLRVTSVYIGGGTPTFIGAQALAEIMDCVHAHYNIMPDCEISCEANPGTVTREGFAVMREAGINRLSIGVQAAQDDLLRAIGRIHTAAQVRAAFEDARAAGFDNINLDFMYALPGQTPEMWRESLAFALALAPEHLSLYSLILEDGTRLKAAYDAGSIRLPGEDAELEMADITRELLAPAGYERYEISNYCLPMRECLHNVLYWQNDEYLGLGCAAHSRLGLMRPGMARLYNSSDIDDYMARVEATGSGCADRLELTNADDAFDTIMLGTRMTDGISLAALAVRHGRELRDKLMPVLTELERRGLAALEGERFRLTERGMMLQNTVLVEIMEAMERN